MAAEIRAGLLAGVGDDLALRGIGNNAELVSDGIKGDDGETGAVGPQPGVLACGGQAGHHDDLESSGVVRGVVRLAVFGAEVFEARVRTREGEGARQTVEVAA